VTEYLTTREVAELLRLNEKKVYDLVRKGQLPAARVSGKWLFPRRLVDEWVSRHTIHPAIGLMGALLDEMVVVQGSDDYLFSRATGRYLERQSVPVVSARVGSLAGLSAVGAGKAHLAGCHVDNAQVRERLACREGCYLIHLYSREQGLLFDAERHPGIRDLEEVGRRGLRFADRQELSGTYRLVERLLDGRDLIRVGPYASHLELALAIRMGEADAGVGIRVAAEMTGLAFAPLHTEPFKLAVPVAFAAHPGMAGFLDFILAELNDHANRGVAGYGFDDLGKMETLVDLQRKENRHA
jgi:excisionase family DNA binding protein